MTGNPLTSAIKRGDADRVAIRLRTMDAAAANALDGHGYTPLMHAAMRSEDGPELVQLLLRHGADPNAQATTVFKSGYSVSSIALGAGDPFKVPVLLDAGGGRADGGSCRTHAGDLDRVANRLPDDVPPERYDAVSQGMLSCRRRFLAEPEVRRR